MGRLVVAGPAGNCSSLSVHLADRRHSSRVADKKGERWDRKAVSSSQSSCGMTATHLFLPGDRLASFRRKSFSCFLSISLSMSGLGGLGGSFVGERACDDAGRTLLPSCGRKVWGTRAPGESTFCEIV